MNNKHILETLKHLIDFCEERHGKLGVVKWSHERRAALEKSLNAAKESYNKAVKAFAEPTEIPRKRRTKT